jgi:hypothetical protein
MKRSYATFTGSAGAVTHPLTAVRAMTIVVQTSDGCNRDARERYARRKKVNGT